MRLCPGCMQWVPTASSVCPACGYDQDATAVSSRVLRPGTVLNDKYLVGRTLGEGGFGITYLAWDTNMQSRIAIKEFFPGYLASRDVTVSGSNDLTLISQSQERDYQSGLERFVREAGILARYSDLPGVVSVRDFFYENQTAYLVMEYIDGISLKEYLKERGGRIPCDEVLRIMEPVVRALIAVHSDNLLHRDISPDNIMIDRSGNVRLIDFGAARYYGTDEELSMTVMLKHGYAPLEQYSRRGDHGAWTDVYSLSATIYHMITGEVPTDAVDRQVSDRLAPMRSFRGVKVSGYIDSVIRRGMSLLPEKRQQSMQEFYDELYISREELRAVRKNKLKRDVLLVVLLSLIVLSCLLIFGMMRAGKKDAASDEASIVSEQNEKNGETDKKDSDKNSANASDNKNDHASDSADKKSPITDRSEQNTAIDSAEINKSTEKTTQESEAISYAIMVVREGTFDTSPNGRTVGEIFDAYCDDPGSWSGEELGNGTVRVIYAGIKDAVPFTIEFEVIDTRFSITGVTQNGSPMRQYTAFVQGILGEEG
ncbi:MAG: protein kinase [Lachnospiraceae bacterium]|nr:protein kinase [Lachnospiraceae bacterium]